MGLLAAALFLFAQDSYGDSCPSEEWAQNLGWKADAIAPEGTTVAYGWIGDCDGQRAVMVHFETVTTPRAAFCAAFTKNAQERGWTVTAAQAVVADSGGRYCGLVATKEIDSRRAYVFMGPTGFYAAPHRLDAYY